MLSAAGFGLLLVAFGLSTSFTLSLVLCGGIGLLSAFSGINTNTMMQTHADARMRGRVISLHGLTMMGIVPIGAMLAGPLLGVAVRFDYRWAYAINAALCALGLVLLLMMRTRRTSTGVTVS